MSRGATHYKLSVELIFCLTVLSGFWGYKVFLVKLKSLILILLNEEFQTLLHFLEVDMKIVVEFNTFKGPNLNNKPNLTKSNKTNRT